MIEEAVYLLLHLDIRDLVIACAVESHYFSFNTSIAQLEKQ